MTTAERVLNQIEAEILHALVPRQGAKPAAAIQWRTIDAPRVTRLLESKARLLGINCGEVRVEAIYAWLDEVADELMFSPPKSRKRESGAVAPELMDPDLLMRVRRDLRLRFRDSAAAQCTALFMLAAVITLLGMTYPMLRSVFGPYPDLAGAFFSLLGIGVAAYLAIAVPIWVRRGGTSL